MDGVAAAEVKEARWSPPMTRVCPQTFPPLFGAFARLEMLSTAALCKDTWPGAVSAAASAVAFNLLNKLEATASGCLQARRDLRDGPS